MEEIPDAATLQTQRGDLKARLPPLEEETRMNLSCRGRMHKEDCGGKSVSLGRRQEAPQKVDHSLDPRGPHLLYRGLRRRVMGPVREAAEQGRGPEPAN